MPIGFSNSDFESVQISTNGVVGLSNGANGQLPNWTVVGAGIVSIMNGTASGVTPTPTPNPNQFLQFQYVGAGITQSLAGLTIGTVYTITFACTQRTGGSFAGNIEVFFDSTSAGSISPTTSWADRNVTFTATATSHTIKFEMNVTGGISLLDNIRVSFPGSTATSFTESGAGKVYRSVAATLTLSMFAAGTFPSASVNIACSDNSAGGTFSVSPVAFTTADTSKTVTYTPSSTASGVITFTFTASGAFSTVLSVQVRAFAAPVFNLAVIGDSLQEGYNEAGGLWRTTAPYFPLSFDPPSEALECLGARFTGVNIAVNGQNIAYFASTNFATRVTPSFDSTKQKNILVMAIGTNDLIATNGNTAYTAYQALRAQAIAGGWKVIGCTVLPRSNVGISNATHEANRLLFNAALVADSAGYDAICDFAADDRFGQSQGQNSDTNWYFDTCHLTKAGYAVTGGYIASASLAVANVGVMLANDFSGGYTG